MLNRRGRRHEIFQAEILPNKPPDAPYLIVFFQKYGIFKTSVNLMMPNMSRLFRVPHLTRPRIFLALAVAAGADGLQFLLAWLGPLEWVFVDPVIDTAAAAVTTWLLGFHVLLLPTYVAKLIPFAEDLPTWTGCVAAVIFLRTRTERLEKAKFEVRDMGPSPAPPVLRRLAEKTGEPDRA
jgi:hypothetical protein